MPITLLPKITAPFLPFAESPLDDNLIWAGTDDGNLQYTTDGGKTWTNVAANYAAAGIPAQTWVSSIEPSPV